MKTKVVLSLMVVAMLSVTTAFGKGKRRSVQQASRLLQI